MGNRKPVRGWSVQDVVAHLVGVNAFWHASVVAGLAGTPTRVLMGFDPAATPPLLIASMSELTPAEVLEQFVASNDAFLDALDALDAAQWSATAETPAGHVPIRLLAQHALWDGWIHERDIALPLGAVPTVETDEVASCLRYAAAVSPAFAITAGSPQAGVFSVAADDPDVAFVVDLGETVRVRAGADDGPCLRGGAVDLVEALSLRAPLPATAPAEWRALLAGLAMAFDVDLETA